MRKRILKYILVLFVIAFIVNPCVIWAQQNLTNEQVVKFFERLSDYKTQDISPLFSKEFLKLVSPAQLKEILGTFEQNYGKFVKAELKEDNTVLVEYERAKGRAFISFDNEGKVSGLLYKNFTVKDDDFEKVKTGLLSQKGTVSACIRKNGMEIFSINSDVPLAVGSSFKLYVLKVLADKVETGNAGCDDILFLKEEQKSLPSGILQDWPAGSPLTLSTLANLMISQSDNTATDMLIDYLGRENIEKIAPKGCIPFIKTTEMFKLKWGVDKGIAENFINGTVPGKRDILKALEAVNINIVNINKIQSPVYIDKIEWFVSTEDLCRVIEGLSGCPALAVNSGLAEKKDWYYAGFKGGSEPGVLNYTHLLQKTKGGDIYSISATINNTDEAVDTGKSFTMLVQRLINLCK